MIKHFIAGVEESGKYVGFCSLGLSCQPIENVQLRNHFRMRPEITGVLVSKINPLSDAYKVLKKDDIILVFDGVPVANDGTGSHLLFPNFNNTNVWLWFVELGANKNFVAIALSYIPIASHACIRSATRS